MNKPSERIVVFVTPAQKRAISATADNLGISISELMRRAVMNFGATSEQVKAASIVDRLRAPREPDALNAALQRVARASKHVRQATPSALRPSVTHDESTRGENDTVRAATAPQEPLASSDAANAVDPVAALAALNPPEDADTDESAAVQAAARVTAAKAAAIASHEAPNPLGATDNRSNTHAADTRTPARTSTLLSSKRNLGVQRRQESESDEPDIDPAEGSGRFA